MSNSCPFATGKGLIPLESGADTSVDKMACVAINTPTNKYRILPFNQNCYKFIMNTKPELARTHKAALEKLHLPGTRSASAWNTRFCKAPSQLGINPKIYQLVYFFFFLVEVSFPC